MNYKNIIFKLTDGKYERKYIKFVEKYRESCRRDTLSGRIL